MKKDSRYLIKDLFISIDDIDTNWKKVVIVIEYVHLVERETRSTGYTKQLRPVLPTSSYRDDDVQLDQFSNISGTGQCPTALQADAAFQWKVQQCPNEIYFLIQMSR